MSQNNINIFSFDSKLLGER